MKNQLVPLQLADKAKKLSLWVSLPLVTKSFVVSSAFNSGTEKDQVFRKGEQIKGVRITPT